MKHLHLADDLKLPAAIDEQHMIVLGKTRSGKSSVIRLFVESLLERRERVCVIDPKGDWWGLKASADGKSAGYGVVIFGGEKADVPINEHAGAKVAELVATGNRPCVIDLGGWMVAERTRFFIQFASTLFRSIDQPLQLVIDECHNFAPQQRNEKGGDAPKMLHWANRLASEGAGKGIVLKSASQRPQKTHKDYVTSHETLVAMRVVHPLDRNAIKDWIDGCGDPSIGKEVITTLAGMQRGEGWVWSPEAGFGPKRIQFPMFRTYDSFAAPTSGARKKLKGWAAVDLDDVRAKLDAVVKEAAANDPKALKAEIVRLQAELAKKPAAAVAAPPAAKVKPPKEVKVLKNDQIKRLESAAAKISAEADRQGKTLAELVKRQEDLAATIVAAVRSVGAPTPTAVAPPLRPSAATPPRRAAAPAPPRKPAGDRQAGPVDVGGKGGRRRLMIAMAQFPEGVTDRKLSILADIAQGGGTWRTYMAELRGAGYCYSTDETTRRNVATPEGIAALGKFDPLPTGAELITYWKKRLGDGGKGRLFSIVVDAYPKEVDAEALAEQAGVAIGGGTWRTYMAELRGLEIISGSKQIKAADVFGE